VSPKKKPFKRRRKKLLDSSAFFPSIDTSNKQWQCYWVSIVITYKYHHEEVRTWRTFAAARPSPTRNTKRWHKTTKSTTDARTVENGTPYVYMILNTVYLFWRE
jgi:hypothetical protein